MIGFWNGKLVKNYDEDRVLDLRWHGEGLPDPYPRMFLSLSGQVWILQG